MSRSIIFAPDAFKGTISAELAARALAEGWGSVRGSDRLRVLPQADGGEGTLAAFARASPASRRHEVSNIEGPGGSNARAHWLTLPDGTAVVELADAAGLPRWGSADPLGASSRALGQVLSAALRGGAQRLLVGLGGSASTDGGVGALAALGARFLDAADGELPGGGGGLARLHRVDLTGLHPPPTGGVTLLADVGNPLLGAHGAAAVFAPQKGASAAQVDRLAAGLARLRAVVGREDFAGAGAAGGAAYGLVALWGAELVSGADVVARETGLDEAIVTADLVIAGEGSFDSQSRGGKVVGRLLDRCRARGVATMVVAGRVIADPGVPYVELATLAGGVAEAMADPERWLTAAGAVAARKWSSREAATQPASRRS